jgi:hypothetical protein
LYFEDLINANETPENENNFNFEFERVTEEAEEIHNEIDEIQFRTEILLLDSPIRNEETWEFDFNKYYDTTKGTPLSLL